MPSSNITVSHLKKWEKCRKKFALEYIYNLDWPSDDKNFRLGKGVHQLLDYGSNHLPLDPILAAADADIAQTWQLLAQSRWANLPVVASEWGFSLSLGKYWLYGRIDRIVQDGEKIIILDWKTGTSIPLDPENDWQTLIYLYAVIEAQRDLDLHLAADNLQFVYVQAKKGQLDTVNISYSPARHKQTQQQLLETLHAIETAENAMQFPLPPRCPDRYCPYDTVCGIQQEALAP